MLVQPCPFSVVKQNVQALELPLSQGLSSECPDFSHYAGKNGALHTRPVCALGSNFLLEREHLSLQSVTRQPRGKNRNAERWAGDGSLLQTSMPHTQFPNLGPLQRSLQLAQDLHSLLLLKITK